MTVLIRGISVQVTVTVYAFTPYRGFYAIPPYSHRQGWNNKAHHLIIMHHGYNQALKN